MKSATIIWTTKNYAGLILQATMIVYDGLTPPEYLLINCGGSGGVLAITSFFLQAPSQARRRRQLLTIHVCFLNVQIYIKRNKK